jgi:hypothetical protein
MSLILMVNEKFREDVPVWTTFQSRPDAFAAFLLAVFRLPRAALTTSERVAYLVFLTHVYQVYTVWMRAIMVTFDCSQTLMANHGEKSFVVVSTASKDVCRVSASCLCVPPSTSMKINSFSSTPVIYYTSDLCASLISGPPHPQSLEQPVVRKTALSMVSLSLWTSISAGRLAEQLRETPEYAPHMRAAAERKAGADHQRERETERKRERVLFSRFLYFCMIPIWARAGIAPDIPILHSHDIDIVFESSYETC